MTEARRAVSDREKWEERWHPLRREWVIVAAHRQDRPWSGGLQDHSGADVPEHDPDCHFCPGNVRISGIRNPNYESIFVFDNDHPCVGVSAPRESGLLPPAKPYANRPANGLARVVCYHPRHDLSLSRLTHRGVVDLLECWKEQYQELGRRPGVNHVLIFENKGQAVGVSNPHPHCQIYATNFVFKTIETETAICSTYYQRHGRTILDDMIAAEVEDGRRIVTENPTAIGFVPYCARWAYETYVAPKRACTSIADLTEEETDGFAAVLREIVIRYDNLWQIPFPYILVLHNAPTDDEEHPGFHFHIEFHPPLRKPNLLKHLAGPETGGGSFLSDTWPEDKAAELKAVSDIHYDDC
ncbi:MAG: galactose-1-phosphate uridylyltransferase [Rhodothermia bacterium]